MTDADYRDMASEIRDLIPLLIHPQAVADLRVLAARYETLAHYLEVVPDTLPDTLLEYIPRYPPVQSSLASNRQRWSP